MRWLLIGAMLALMIALIVGDAGATDDSKVKSSPAHVGGELSRRIRPIEIARAQLIDVDVDRRKRIDDAIDYFGAGHIDVAQEG